MGVKGNPWLREIEDMLADIAAWVYGVAPFELAVLGEEAAAIGPDAPLLDLICRVTRLEPNNRHRPYTA